MYAITKGIDTTLDACYILRSLPAASFGFEFVIRKIIERAQLLVLLSFISS